MPHEDIIKKMITLGELTTSVAHEIKNSLTGISGALEVFAEDFLQDDPHGEIINEVLNEIWRLDKLVKDLLTFARPPELNMVQAGVEEILERVNKSILSEAEKHGISVNMVLSGDLPEMKVDPEQMEQVFLNIALNVFQSMPHGGIVTIATSYRPEANEVEILFINTGNGISENDVKSALGRLRLSISRDIVENHNGRLVVEKESGIRNIFRIILPGN